MTKLFRVDSPYMRFMTKLFDLILLNLLFVACCIPLVTIGASLTALHTVTLKAAAGEEPYVVKCFFKAFKANFKQATLSWLIMLAAIALLYVDSRMASYMGTGGLFIQIVLGFASILCFLVMLYLFPIQARYENTIRANYKNAILLALCHFPKTLLLAFPVMVVVALLLYGSTKIFVLMLVLLLLVGGAAIAGLQDKLILKIFLSHEAGEEEEDDDDEEEDDDLLYEREAS